MWTNLICLNRLGEDEGEFIGFYKDGVAVDSIQLDGAGGITYGADY